MADKEKLSALMDGEMIDKSLISELENDQEGIQSWKNYHLIGDVMRGEAPEKPEWNIAESVALALENEPAHNPLHSDKVLNLEDAKLEAQPKPASARRRLPKWLSPFGQVAVAASVTLAVVMSIGGQPSGSSSDPSVQSTNKLQTMAFGTTSPASFTLGNEGNQAASQYKMNVIRGYNNDLEKQMLMRSQSN
ncbi:sigma-E factor negative regulatory protein [Vibrio marisflavi]|uniref:Anti-sigma-E factor RseA n=1 Tax=Vibrio marisflavi CECT 7928 TaxID=634439 RepID=A0ABM9A7X9_9VIBR|nr:RseA family anti-sigma factor [Vibrio marisflavi]CAH0541407.1 Anti-sigma-E factor RseA [Vibrio marisflavi CECT 7928]